MLKRRRLRVPPMAGVAERPMCEFCDTACNTFDEYGCPIMNIRIVGEKGYELCYDFAVKIDEMDDDRQVG